jgi:prophage DNA circulation protein
MEYMNNNPIEEEAVFEAPVYEAPVVEETVEEHIEETPVVEEAAQAVVETPAYEAPEEVQALGSVADGVIGATTAVKAAPRKKSAKPDEKKETVALYSTKNVTWSEVGKVYRGYNIVDKDAAEKWLTRSHIRTATPEEIAKEFGK